MNEVSFNMDSLSNFISPIFMIVLTFGDKVPDLIIFVMYFIHKECSKNLYYMLWQEILWNTANHCHCWNLVAVKKKKVV